jgi:hypothetical protein
MTLRRFLTLFAALAVTATFVHAQGQNSEHSQNTYPKFREHRVGESAQEFFSIAKMAEKSGMLSTDYCRSFLDDPKVKKTIEKARRKRGDDPSLLAVMMNVEGCGSIQAALAGQDVDVDVRYAAEFGSGRARFVAGHLASVRFVVKAPFNNVVEDMTAKLNANPQLGVETLQNSVAQIVKQHRATWTLPDILVRVSDLQSLEGDYAGTEVLVSNPAMMKHRTNSLD